MNTTDKILATLLVLVAMFVVAFVAYEVGADKPAVNNTIIQKELVIDNATAAKVDALALQIASLDEFEAEADEDLQNETAKTLVADEIAKKSFKKALVAKLNDNALENQSVEEYKDLTCIEFEIKEVELDDEDATVTVTLWVNGYNDDDEKDDFESRIKATFNVVDLDVDEIDDAEVENFELIVDHFYD